MTSLIEEEARGVKSVISPPENAANANPGDRPALRAGGFHARRSFGSPWLDRKAPVGRRRGARAGGTEAEGTGPRRAAGAGEGVRRRRSRGRPAGTAHR